MEHAVVLARGDRITLRDLPASVRQAGSEAPTGRGPMPARGAITVKEAERELIIRALKESDGNRTMAARKLGMSRRTMHRKLHTYQLENL
jgi:transcriptional regulator of acetoin/glycerol metabolism